MEHLTCQPLGHSTVVVKEREFGSHVRSLKGVVSDSHIGLGCVCRETDHVNLLTLNFLSMLQFY